MAINETVCRLGLCRTRPNSTIADDIKLLIQYKIEGPTLASREWGTLRILLLNQDLRPGHPSSRLLLRAENDYDSNGLALMDEFSDAITAYVPEPLDGDIEVLSVIDL